ncbi:MULTISPECIES: DUF6049 family protein [unclassified Gordonia (in: high G+C Gram-positive bacteria)]|uniref:DUF6049 family protein n=1 Tax=unclassified Gordonia (in: high G+C Gram-positive bacteria) TaxID=2657482 RepID=UPI0007E974B0|nr:MULTISPECIES: DUF6049 family protein [unclassified Gordonia (in: high G+C Gram-positive bacteria)]OBC02130.1 hypothetical protein A5785_16880 [Gordonia sp. 852002-50395_SCH5434458]OBC06153.1 hypothetical protein A5786_10395 [Gordonia sp. 852002-50816_SCH5313054-a]OBC17839.1 hypothetical protein A5788_11615 [Gordonia sp. 852002-50816_SCH5313054-c]
MRDVLRIGSSRRLSASFVTRARVLLAVVGVVIVAALCAAPAAAVPTTGTSGATTSPSDDQRFASVVIDTLTPSMVTTTSGPDVTVEGHVRNTSSRTIKDLSIRLERGDAVRDAAGLRSSLAVAHPPIAVAGAFRNLTDELAPGAEVSFRINMSLSGESGMQISRPGVYPLQVNVNGVPDYGSMAQVAGSRTLLPVLSLPPDKGRAAQFDSSEFDSTPGSTDSTSTSGNDGLGADGAVSADISDPARITMLWPLAAPPQLAPGGLGGGTQPVRLISDDMARSLRDGGRLHELLESARNVVGTAANDSAGGAGTPGDSGSASNPPASGSGSATSGSDTSSGSATSDSQTSGSGTPGSANPGSGTSTAPTQQTASDLQRSMCLAVDPDLLVTVRAMSLGYEVSSNPADPTSRTTPGTGSDAATQWLADLRGVAARTCVVALPFSQTDLTSLARIERSGLTAAALDAPADVVDAILGVRSVRGLTIPALGAVDQAGSKLLRDTGHGKVLASASSVDPTGNPNAAGLYNVGGLLTQTYDSSVSAAMGAVGTAPLVSALTPPSQQFDLDAESPVSRRQAAVAALAFRSIATPGSSTSGELNTSTPVTNTAGRADVVMPPTYWSATSDDASALFSTATVLFGSRAATPAPLDDLVNRIGGAAAPARLVEPPGIGPVSQIGPALTDRTVDSIRSAADESWRLQGALVDSADVDASPERYVSQLREDLLRSIRSPDENNTATRTRLGRERQQRVDAVHSTLRRMHGSVTILDPGGRYTLASERSPLLLVVRNDLALPIRVRITTTAPKDLEIGDVGVVEIPARGTRQIQLPTHAQSSEAMTVTIGMSTVTGVTLGTPIKLSVYSNAYGKPLFIVTICAAVALILLTARRLWRRFRGRPDPADQDRPEPDELERMLAASTYQQRRRTLQQEEALVETDQFDGIARDDAEPPRAKDDTALDSSRAVDSGRAVDSSRAKDSGTDRTGA